MNERTKCFRIEVRVEGQAFCPAEWAERMEVARILRDLSAKVHDEGLNSAVLRDINGNSCGAAWVSEGKLFSEPAVGIQVIGHLKDAKEEYESIAATFGVGYKNGALDRGEQEIYEANMNRAKAIGVILDLIEGKS